MEPDEGTSYQQLQEHPNLHGVVDKDVEYLFLGVHQRLLPPASQPHHVPQMIYLPTAPTKQAVKLTLKH